MSHTTNSNQAPAWFSNTVIEGVQLLLLLSLPGTPAAETVSGTALAWVDLLWGNNGQHWQEKPDTQRLREAFRSLGAASSRWPAPSELRQHLPARPLQPRLPAPGRTEQERQDTIARSRAIAQMLRQNATTRSAT